MAELSIPPGSAVAGAAPAPGWDGAAGLAPAAAAGRPFGRLLEESLMAESSGQRADEGVPVDEINEALLSVLGPAGATLPPQLVGRLLATSTAADTGAAAEQATANAGASTTALLDAFIARRIAASDAPATTTPSAPTPTAVPESALAASDGSTTTTTAQSPSAESVDVAAVPPAQPAATRITVPSAPEAADVATAAVLSDVTGDDTHAVRVASPQPDPSVRPFVLGREPSVVPAGAVPGGIIDGSRNRDGLLAAAHDRPSSPAAPAPPLGAAPSATYLPGIEQNAYVFGRTAAMPQPVGVDAPQGSERNPILGQPSLAVPPAAADRTGPSGAETFLGLNQELAGTDTGAAATLDAAERGVAATQTDGGRAAAPSAPASSDAPLPLTGAVMAAAPPPAGITRPAVSHQPSAAGAPRAEQSVASAMSQTVVAPSTAQPVDQVAGALAMNIREGRTEVSISLRPATLGAVNVRIVAGRDGLVIHIAAERTDAGDLLRSQLVELRQALVNHQIPVAELHVLHNPPPAPPAGPEQPAPWTEERSASRRESEQEGGRRREGQDQDDDEAG
jgi:hypothetical protein